jgi:hypothetical protein
MRVFTSHFRRKYDAIAVEGVCIDAMIDAVSRPHNTTYAEPLERPIDTDENRTRCWQGEARKPLGVMGSARNFRK